MTSARPGTAADVGPAPRVKPVLDARFRPAVLAIRQMKAEKSRSRKAASVWVALEQPGGSVSHHAIWVLPQGHPASLRSYRTCERLLKFLLWARGASRIYVDAPADLVEALRHRYAREPAGIFDAQMMGPEIYGRAFEVVATRREAFPAPGMASTRLGGHLQGCRIGFDLGASDRKVAAVVDGRTTFSEELPWDPAGHADPQWHFDQIMLSLRRAAAHLPRVDAIGGSAAGVYVDGEVRVSSLFRGVPRPEFDRRVRGLFRELQHAWDDIPFVVVNDGEVAALAGSMAAGVGGLLGIAMGSSLAAGYVTRAGAITSWLNELAFAPVDVSVDAPVDEWSGDRGCGVQYLSQQAVGRLLPAAGIAVDDAMTLPDRLVALQSLMDRGDPRAASVYQTIGVYLGYALLQYHAFYDFGHVLVLGRVMTGAGGDVVVEHAQAVLRAEDSSAGDNVSFHTMSERDKRHGQAVAAASLPSLA